MPSVQHLYAIRAARVCHLYAKKVVGLTLGEKGYAHPRKSPQPRIEMLKVLNGASEPLITDAAPCINDGKAPLFEVCSRLSKVRNRLL